MGPDLDNQFKGRGWRGRNRDCAVGPRPGVFLNRMNAGPSGSSYSVTLATSRTPGEVAVDPAGNASVTYYDGAGALVLAHFDSQGKLVFSKLGAVAATAIAMDAAGNTYSAADAFAGNLVMKNSVASGGTGYLTVFGPAGDVLQLTWFPAAAYVPLLAVRPDSTTYVVGSSASTVDAEMLPRFSPNAPVPRLRKRGLMRLGAN